MAMIYAPSGIGKSWLTLSIAAASAGGGKLHEWQAPSPQRVLLIDGEMDAADLKSRLTTIFKTVETEEDKAVENLFVWARKDPKREAPFPDLADEDGRKEVLTTVRELKPALVILDNVSTLADIRDENAADAWNPFLETLRDISHAGSAVLVVHHARKSSSSASGAYRGSQKLSVELDAIIRLEESQSLAATANGASFTLRFEKSRGLCGSAKQDLEAVFASDGKGASRWTFEVNHAGQLYELVQRVRDGKFATQTDIAAAYDVNKGTVTRWKEKAIARQLITHSVWDDCLRDAARMRKVAPASLSEENDDF